MEARTKQQQLLFDKGITNVPSDNLCSDNTLAESVGMVYEDGEHRVIQRPVEFITSAVAIGGTAMDIPVIVYIHTFDNEERFIGHIQSGTKRQLCWGTVESGVFVLKEMFMLNNAALYYEADMSITSIGKTLIISNKEKGFLYYLWKTNEYSYVGDIPDIDIEYWLALRQNQSGQSHAGRFTSEGLFTGIIEYSSDLFTEILDQESYNDLIVGLYSKNKRRINQAKGFCNPFFVRAALEMYDGSYTKITNPVLMFPSVTMNSYASHNELHSSSENIRLSTMFLWMFCTQKTDYSAFSDIIKGITLFVTEDVDVNDTLADHNISLINEGGLMYDRVMRLGSSVISDYSSQTRGSTQPRYYKALDEKDKIDVINEIKSSSVFYKLCEIGIKPVTGLDTSTKILKHTLENLTTQEVLPYDDFYSRNKLYPNFVYSYNSRLNIANTERGFFEGFGNFMPYDNSDRKHIYDYYVTIETDVDEFSVHHQEETYQKQGIYFYYPDSRAKHVVIFKDSSCILDVDLEEHPMLNGAFYFSGRPHVDEEEPSGASAQVPSYDNNAREILPNYIIQTEVENPWVFMAQGYFKVGTGEIIGMSSITQALSEGQFGSYPLLVFSESGIWALSVADTGYYSSIHPMSREVCNNARSITQTDGAVFFTSEKGLMVIVGNQVKCVSEQLSGKQDLYSDAMFPSSVIGNVSNFFRTCYIAYDYRDSLLWIMGNAPGAEHCYIYSIKSGTFSKYHLPQLPRGCVNYYPDYLIQTNPSGKVYSLLQRPNINLDYVGETTNPRQYTATMLTRPMKMENALALKSIMHLKNIKLFSPYTITENDVETPHRASLTLRIFASNDLENWVERTSLRGVPFKYYRFRFDFADLIATDRFAGTVVVTQERRTDKIR